MPCTFSIHSFLHSSLLYAILCCRVFHMIQAPRFQSGRGLLGVFSHGLPWVLFINIYRMPPFSPVTCVFHVYMDNERIELSQYYSIPKRLLMKTVVSIVQSFLHLTNFSCIHSFILFSFSNHLLFENWS